MVNKMSTAVRTFGEIIIESRVDDSFVNATRMCKSGGKSFGQWHRLARTKKLIYSLENTTREVLVETARSRYHSTWIHPDLSIQLAQWISPAIALQISRWIRELTLEGSVAVKIRNLDEVQNILLEISQRDLEIEQKERVLEALRKDIERMKR